MSKVLVSCDEYVFLYNGQYYVREFGQILINRYLDVFENVRFSVRTKTVYTLNNLGIYNIPVVDDRIEIFPIPFFQGPKEYAKKYFSIKKIIKKSTKGCSWAIIRVPSTIGFATLKYVRKQHIPHFLEVVADPSELMKSSNFLSKIFMFIMHYQQLKACKHANGVSYVTKNTLQKKYPTLNNSWTSFYSSVELSNQLFNTSRQYPEKKPFVICHVSNPIKTYNKGHIIVLEVIKILKDKGYNVVAEFAGEGPLIPSLQQYAKNLNIENSIKFVGLLDQVELKNFLNNAGIMLFPTASEGLPRVIIEAMATGLPCLATKVGGIPELLPEDLMFSANNKNGFAEKIAEMIDNEETYMKWSNLAYIISKEFKADKLQKKRIEFYNKLKNIGQISDR